MPALLRRLTTPSGAAALCGVVLFAALCGAWVFQYVVGLVPCHLCLVQRMPYYAGIPLSLALAVLVWRGALPAWAVRGGLLVLLGILLWSAGLGVYHSGVEWKLWAGPADCTGGGVARISGDLVAQLSRTRVVMCDEAAWRFLGLSLAGYNVLVSAGLAAFVAAALCPYGSSSQSQ